MSETTEEQPSVDAGVDESYGEFTPGTIVLAKLKSFPPWPAIVIPDELVPERIQSSKPKNPSRSSTQRSKRRSQARTAAADQTPSRLWCVRFLRDDTFMWATSNDISILTKSQIESFLKSKKAKKVIKSAYEMALDPPDVEEFIIYGSDGKPMDIDNEANDEDFQDEDTTPDEGDEDEDDIDSEIDDDDNDLEITTVKKSSRKGTTPAKRKKKSTPAKPTKRAKSSQTPSKRGNKKDPVPELDPDTSSDEDWDVDVDPTEEPVCTIYPDPKAIADLIKKRTPLLKKANLQLYGALLSGSDISKDLSSTIATLNTLESLKNPEIALINKSGLHKTLFAILKRPDLVTKDLKNIRKRISSLVLAWYDLGITIDENWTFDNLEENDEVKIEDADVSMTNDESTESKDLVK